MNDMILIINYADEATMEIARRLRSEQVYARIAAPDTTAKQVRELAPRGVILSGEAAGREGDMDSALLELGIPVLALGHAAHLLLRTLGGAEANEALTERKALMQLRESALFAGMGEGERYFTHAMTLMLPANVREIATAAGCTIAYEDKQNRHFGVQFELERNDPDSSAILMNFAREICGCSAWWTLDAATEHAQAVLAQAAAQGGHALCAVSGGVDSTLAALLTHQAFGERMTAVLMDNGLMREGEVETVCATFKALGVPLALVDKSEEILRVLADKQDAKHKREVVVRSLYGEMIARGEAIEGEKTLVLGTNYSDFLHGGTGAEEWARSGMTVVEPLMELFKDEVRAIARRLGMAEAVVDRKPFPALGLGARIVGKISAERLHALRTAEAIFREEIELANLERKLYKYFPVLIGEDGREMLLLRAVTLSGGMLTPARLPYDLVERTVQRIMAALAQVERVVYDQTPTQVGRETYE